MKVELLTNQHCLRYPVGLYIDEAIAFVKKAMRLIITKQLIPDTNISIWCRGSSGSILAALLYSELTINNYSNIRIYHIKKPNETSHDNNCSYNDNAYNIVIDDMVCSGDTIKAIEIVIETNNLSFDCLIVSAMDYKDCDENVSLKHRPPKLLITSEHSIRRSMIKHFEAL